MAKHHLTMRQLVQIRFWIGILLACLVQISPAVEPYTPTYAEPVMEPWRWQVYDDPDFRDAECLFKASNGVLWIGSLKGVIRYDGKTRIRFGESEGFYWKSPLQFQEASDGTIYYCTTKTVHFFKNGKWSDLFTEIVDRPCEIKFLIVDSNDTAWLGLTIGMLQIEKDERTLWVPRLNFDLKKFNGIFTRVCVIGSSDSIDLNKPLVPSNAPKAPVQFIAGFQGKEGSLWLSTSDQRLYRLEPGSTQAGIDPRWSSYSLPKSIRLPYVSQICEISDGSVWIVGSDSTYPIVRFDPSRNEWKSLREEIPFVISNFQNSIVQILDGTIWICGENSLLKYKNRHWQQFKGRDIPFSEPEIIHLMAAADQSLWLTFRKKGIARLDLSADRWLTYQGLHFQVEEPNGSQWFTSTDHRVVHKQADQWRVFGKQDGLINFPQAIFVTRSGMTWAYGSHNGAAAVSWFVKGQWRKKVCENFAIELTPYSVLEDPDGVLWFGSRRQNSSKSHVGGVLRCTPALDGESMAFSIFSNPPGDHFYVEGIAQDVDGTILAGGQLKRLIQGKLEPYREKGLPLRMIYLLNEGQKCWMLTGRFDLLLKEGTKRTLFKSSDSSVDRDICNFLSWNSTTLWAGTDHGIYYFDGSAWTQQSLHQSLAQSSNIYGLRSNKEHTLWINLGRKNSSVRFSELFRSVRYQKGNHVPETRIVQSPLNGRHYQADALALEWNGSDLWNQTPTAELHYSYRFNQGTWSPFSAKTQRVFSDLSIGKQHFEVRARNRDLNIDPTPATVSFMIVGPLWLRPSFILMTGLLIVTIVVLVIRLIRSHDLRLTDQLKFEKEQAEQHQKLDRFRLEFFTNISHELRTPLTLILGPLEKLQNGARTPELKAQGTLAKRNANRLLSLVNQLLDMRKLHAGQMRLEVSRSDVVGFIREIASTFTDLAEKKSLVFELEIPAESKLISFDPDKLEKILGNLLSNAIKFTPKGGTVRLQANMEAAGISLLIEDSGAGIDPEYHQLIFERFGQIPSASEVKGTGIGLALVRDLVELHGGSITINSPLHLDQVTPYGTSFLIKLPWPDNDETSEPEIMYPENPVDADETNTTLEQSKILVVEDNSDMREFIRLELSAEFTVLEAVDGMEGLQQAKELTPDLIISDVMMPNMDGFTLCSMLKEDLLTSHIPIILLTARGSQDARLKGFETGVDDYMVKPFHSDLLKVRVRNLLKLRQQLRCRFGDEPEIGPAEVTVSALDTAFLEKAMRIVEDNFQDSDFSAESFAQLMGVSRRGLYSKLRVITDQSVSQFIRTVRLKKAVQLLATNEYSVAEIAYEVGFSSQIYFTRCFTGEFGLSPLKYIKSLS